MDIGTKRQTFLDGVVQRGHAVGVAEGQHGAALAQSLADVGPITHGRPGAQTNRGTRGNNYGEGGAGA